jgi:hypothetical protein
MHGHHSCGRRLASKIAQQDQALLPCSLLPIPVATQQLILVYMESTGKCCLPAFLVKSCTRNETISPTYLVGEHGELKGARRGLFVAVNLIRIFYAWEEIFVMLLLFHTVVTLQTHLLAHPQFRASRSVKKRDSVPFDTL